MDTCSKCRASGIPEGAIACPFCGSRFDAKEDSGLAVTAIVLGIIGLFFCLVPFVGLFISAVGVGFAIPAANKQQKRYEWALGLSLLGVLLGMSFSFIMV